MTTTATAPNTTSPPHFATEIGTSRSRPRWVVPSLLLLLAGTAVLYLGNLGASGYANSFYAAAVQAGSQNWEAWLFGSLDSGNAITVDKPPAALWIMGLSARIFGFTTWSLLVPQALEGVASVWLLYATVRRRFGYLAGLLAAAALALTPVAVLMFRFDNPDSLLVLLMVAGAYCVLRATETASGRWLALAGVAIGFAFLTKMMQGFLVLPAFGLVYLTAAPTTLRRRLLHLLGAVGALIASIGWYVALVELWPASSRPYIGGSTNNSLLELALGYNGLGRILGGAGNGGGGGGGMGNGGNTAFGGSTGITRLFGTNMGSEISWQLPAALIALVGGLWFTRKAPRTDPTRAALLLWGGWLVVTGVVFSFMSGTIHPYYTVALAPAIAALVAIGGRELWRGRTTLGARVVLAAMIASTGLWDFVLLNRDSTWLPAVRWMVLVASAILATLVMLHAAQVRKAATALVAAVVLTGFAGTAAYGVATAAVAHTGSIPASGPASASSTGMGRQGGGMGVGGQSNTALSALLATTTTQWAAAISGDSAAADLELSSGKAVVAIGGWDGSDPAPTLTQFQQWVADGKVSYFLSGGRESGPSGGGSSDSAKIASWVAAHYSAKTVGETSVYDLR